MRTLAAILLSVFTLITIAWEPFLAMRQADDRFIKCDPFAGSSEPQKGSNICFGGTHVAFKSFKAFPKITCPEFKRTIASNEQDAGPHELPRLQNSALLNRSAVLRL